MMRATVRPAYERAKAHSHIRKTAHHPDARSARETARSRCAFRASFVAQKATRVFGVRPWRGQPCQKQPSTNTATFCARKTKSGLPGSGVPRRQSVMRCHSCSEKYLQPMKESAAIAAMPDTIQEIELQVVIQFGGTSKEQYLHSFLNEAAARRFIRNADKASYRCLGPFPLLLSGIRELADVASDTIAWLQSNGFRDTPLANNLNSALAQVEREYPLT